MASFSSWSSSRFTATSVWRQEPRYTCGSTHVLQVIVQQMQEQGQERS